MKSITVAALTLVFASFSLVPPLRALALEGREENIDCDFQFVNQTLDSLMAIRQQMDTDGSLVFRIQVRNFCTNQQETLRIQSINVWSTGLVRVDGYIENPDGSATSRQINVVQASR